jgi:hypothetical protein
MAFVARLAKFSGGGGEILMKGKEKVLDINSGLADSGLEETEKMQRAKLPGDAGIWGWDISPICHLSCDGENGGGWRLVGTERAGGR